MDDLITALTILRKYGNPYNPTHCTDEVLLVCIDPELVSDEDKAALDELSFSPVEYGFRSFRFGSA